MKKNKNNNSIELIHKDASSLAKKWFLLISSQQLDLADNLCFIFIERYKKVLNKFRLKNSHDNYYILHTLLILFKGMQDYVELEKFTQDRNWYKKPKVVEQVWIKKCDCKDRLEFVSNNFTGEIVDKILNSINKLEFFFRQEFGDGYYLSPGLIADKFICNICHKDTRACSHIPGRLYIGTICRFEPINYQLNHVALVEDTKDFRCRIWPWNFNKDNAQNEKARTFKGIILTKFSVDDFLRE